MLYCGACANVAKQEQERFEDNEEEKSKKEVGERTLVEASD